MIGCLAAEPAGAGTVGTDRVRGVCLGATAGTPRGDHLAALTHLTPWRQDRPVTAGLVRLALQRLLGQVNLRDWWNPKSRKFQPPAVAEEMVSGPPSAQAA